MTNPNLWNQILIWPITNLLIAFYKGVEAIGLSWPLGWAIILMTIVIRLLLYPLMKTQLKSARKMAQLKPHLDDLNAKHKGNKQAMQQAQLNLYKQHGVNPAGGCLPLLIQMPILIALYNVFFKVLSQPDIAQVISDINSIVYLPALKLTNLNTKFFGINLGIKPGEWKTHGVWLLAVPIITAGLQWYQARLMQPAFAGNKGQAVSDKNQGSKKKGKDLATKDNKKPEKSDAEQAADMQRQMSMITPLMFGFFAFQFPLGLALYWNVFGLFGIIQQLKVNKEN